MQVVTPELIAGEKVLLRLDFDVPLKGSMIEDDFRLKMGLPTVKLCLENAKSLVLMGHLGRPGGKFEQALSVAPIARWIRDQLKNVQTSCKLDILENLRFEPGEESCDLGFAKELARLGDFFVNDSFAAYRKSVSTTVLPTLLSHAAGLQFFKEVEILTKIRKNPMHPLVAVIGGVKIEEKYQSVLSLARFCDTVLVGGLLPVKIKNENFDIPENVVLGKLNDDGTDLSDSTIEEFSEIIKHSKQVILGGPVGKSAEGTYRIVQAIIDSGAESVAGGGDTADVLRRLNLINRFSFVSTGGGAMLELLSKGILPTIEALDE